MDKEVKVFFFGLSPQQLEPLLQRYGEMYGEKAHGYAIDALPKWRSGATKMSGTVAARLFIMLPPFMPMDLKLRIVEGLWEKQGKKQTDYLLVPPDMEPHEILALVALKCFGYLHDQQIPQRIKQRFDWLSGADASVAEQLLRHLRKIQLQAKEQMTTAIMLLAEQTAAANADVISQVVSTIEVSKHSVSIKRSEWVTAPTFVGHSQFLRGNEPVPVQSDYSWIWWVAGAALILFFLMR
jgi:valyl-tRNA synthetase